MIESSVGPVSIEVEPGPRLGPDVLLTCEEIEQAAYSPRCDVGFTEAARRGMEASCEHLVRAQAAGEPIYGLTTGFGPFVSFDASERAAIQAEGLLAHLGAGWGEAAPREVARATMLVRAQSIAQGTAAIDPGAADAWLELIRRGVTPCIPEVGSVGASGDLIPLAHAARVLAGQGEAWVGGERMAGGAALARVGLEPVTLAARDALALVNGTSFMSGYLAIAVARGERLLGWAERITGWMYRLLGARRQALDPRLHDARGHEWQSVSARQIRGEVESHWQASQDLSRPLQEVYSIRCAPQILGACRENLHHARRLVEREINGVNDNPVVCPDAVLHGGNFQGQQIAFAADALNAALTQTAVLAERQLDVLLNPEFNNGAPLLLAWQPGRDAGLAGVQLTATATVAEMRHRGGPVATSSIPTNGRNQDVVSMGTLAARESLGQTERLASVLGALVIGTARLSDLRARGRASGEPAEAPRGVRVPEPFEHDVPLNGEMEAQRRSLLAA